MDATLTTSNETTVQLIIERKPTGGSWGNGFGYSEADGTEAWKRFEASWRTYGARSRELRLIAVVLCADGVTRHREVSRLSFPA